MSDLSQLFLYRLNNNDPINDVQNSPHSKKGYMTEISDWMTLFNIRPPKNYFSNKASGGIFGQASMEHDINFDYGRAHRRPTFVNRIKMEPQLFGPNIVFSLGTEKTLDNQTNIKMFPIVSSVLPGAGTVEQILESFLNGSYYITIKSDIKDPLKIHIMSLSNLTVEQEVIIKTSLTGFQKHTFEVESDETRCFIQFRMNLCELTFLFGFNSTSDLDDVMNVLS